MLYNPPASFERERVPLGKPGFRPAYNPIVAFYRARCAVRAEWNFADVWQTVAATVPDAIAQVHGERRDDWRTFDRRANGVAARLLQAGLGRHDKVALYLGSVVSKATSPRLVNV